MKLPSCSCLRYRLLHHSWPSWIGVSYHTLCDWCLPWTLQPWWNNVVIADEVMRNAKIDDFDLFIRDPPANSAWSTPFRKNVDVSVCYPQFTLANGPRLDEWRIYQTRHCQSRSTQSYSLGPSRSHLADHTQHSEPHRPCHSHSCQYTLRDFKSYWLACSQSK